MRRGFRLVAVVLALAAAAGCNRLIESPTAPSPPPAPGPAGQSVYYTVIGASDALGVGGSVVCAPFDLDCANGTGYAQQIRRRLQQSGRTVQYRNLGIPGGVLSRAVQDLAQAIGREVLSNFIDQQAPFVPTGTTHVTIFAGGNDANTIGQAVRAGRGGADVRGFIDQQVRQWGNDYETLIQRVRERAPSAQIVVANLPNLGAAPYLAGSPAVERSIMQHIAVGLADRANALASRGVIVVDLLCEPGIYLPANFAPDGFHPSDAGYALMADRLFPALVNGSAPTPSASCPQRALLPAY
ncbi:MAG: SGNH/GDSL hydrolase family protein [Acidobacteriota bacterium]